MKNFVTGQPSADASSFCSKATDIFCCTVSDPTYFQLPTKFNPIFSHQPCGAYFALSRVVRGWHIFFDKCIELKIVFGHSFYQPPDLQDAFPLKHATHEVSEPNIFFNS